MKTQTGKLKLTIITLGLLFASASSGVILEKIADGNSSKSEAVTHRKIMNAESVTSNRELLPIGVLPIFFGTIEASLSGK